MYTTPSFNKGINSTRTEYNNDVYLLIAAKMTMDWLN